MLSRSAHFERTVEFEDGDFLVCLVGHLQAEHRTAFHWGCGWGSGNVPLIGWKRRFVLFFFFFFGIVFLFDTFSSSIDAGPFPRPFRLRPSWILAPQNWFLPEKLSQLQLLERQLQTQGPLQI